MKIVKGSRKQIGVVYSSEQPCPNCGRYERIDVEVGAYDSKDHKAVMRITPKFEDVCAHCSTICSKDFKKSFFCAKCDELIPNPDEKFYSNWKHYADLRNEWLPSESFNKFNEQLFIRGLREGKRFCLKCVNELYEEYKQHPDSLEKTFK